MFDTKFIILNRCIRGTLGIKRWVAGCAAYFMTRKCCFLVAEIHRITKNRCISSDDFRLKRVLI